MIDKYRVYLCNAYANLSFPKGSQIETDTCIKGINLTISIQISEQHPKQIIMSDIFHNFPIEATTDKVFEAISRSEGLDKWWTKGSVVNPAPGGMYTLDFGPGYVWKAIVTAYGKASIFELKMTEADDDWLGTKIGFNLINRQGKTDVNFYHTGWPQKNEHYKISSYCWAMYLRILKRHLEYGEWVPYEKRLQV